MNEFHCRAEVTSEVVSGCYLLQCCYHHWEPPA